ncbi:MAG: cation transporter [Alphaproteobacteria bacterium]
MEHCHSHALDADRRIVWTVLILNFSMFLLEVFQGLQANSSSLIADSIDFLSDSFSYGITLYVMNRSLKARATAAFIKGGLMMCLAAIVLAQGIYNIIQAETPVYTTMGWVGAMALAVNLLCTALLFRFRSRDSNMESVWLCSRNDTIGNLLILIAAGLVYATGSLWPDFAAALVIAGLASTSALKIFAQAQREYHKEYHHDH